MTNHVPVLSQSVIKFLSIRSDDVVLDGTVGAAGHAQAICTQLADTGHLIGIDKDRKATEQAKDKLAETDCQAQTCLRVGSFADAQSIARECGSESVDAALLDLGFRTGQLAASRGFSFQREDPLLMTYKHPEDLEDDDLTAQAICNEWSQESITQILEGYANEDFASQIAEAIVSAREQQPITTTTDLVEIINEAVPPYYRRKGRHPATKTFQALRMAVNDEVRTLEAGLQEVFALLEAGGRLVVISFHSVEDRIVKRFIDEKQSENKAAAVTSSPVRPDESEVSFNPKSRSAKLRCLEKATP